jgi:hypothetical protein
MTSYNVHIYREMRLRFDDIEADSPGEAAEKARDMHFDDAADWSDCEGESLAALIDVQGDEEHSQSEVVDFEPGRLLKAAPAMLSALQDADYEIRTFLEDLCDEPEEDISARRTLAAIASAIAKASGS